MTFFIFGFLVTFYSYCYLYPLITGSFDDTLGLPDFWANQKEKEDDRFRAQVILIVFVFLVVQLFLAILMTMFTDPGRVPQDREYDLPDSMLDNQLCGNCPGNETTTLGPAECEKLLNEDILQDMMYPSEPIDFDFGFLGSKQGQPYSVKSKE